jgi:hypothetical protein
MTGRTTLVRLLLVHACAHVAVALGLLAMAQPVSWSTPTNLDAQDWPFLTGVVLALALILGALQGVLLGVEQRLVGWITCCGSASGAPTPLSPRA